MVTRLAVRSGAIKTNPVVDIAVARTHRPEMVFLDPDQIMDLAREVTAPRTRPAVHTQVPASVCCSQRLMAVRIAMWNPESAKPGTERHARTLAQLTDLDANVVVTTEDSTHDWAEYPYRIDAGPDWGYPTRATGGR